MVGVSLQLWWCDERWEGRLIFVQAAVNMLYLAMKKIIRHLETCTVKRSEVFSCIIDTLHGHRYEDTPLNTFVYFWSGAVFDLKGHGPLPVKRNPRASL